MINYRLTADWPDLPAGFVPGNPTGIGLDSHQNIFIFHRAGRTWTTSVPGSFISSKTILMLDSTHGKIIDSWGDDFFIMPHGLTIDGQDNIWVTDAGLHQVFKFSQDGKLLMKLGQATVTGNDATHFNMPTDVAVTKKVLFM